MQGRTYSFSFYSYKGGSGRSTTLMNTAKHLIDELHASPKSPILIVDTDLESAGLTLYFGMQKRFDSLFADSINTTKVISPSFDFFSGTRKSLLFDRCHTDKVENDIVRTKKIDERLLESLRKALGRPSVESAFGNVRLAPPDMRILAKIADVCNLMVANEYDDEKFDNQEDRKIYETYNIPALADLTDNLAAVCGRENEAELKSKMIADFLPAHGFVDVSSFFDAEDGTVLFLGVDTEYSGEQIRNGSSESLRDAAAEAATGISNLNSACAEYGFSAVLYDSGSGTQGSAHALHQPGCSDVIVYCLRPSTQFINGTAMQLDIQGKNRKKRKNLNKSAGQKDPLLDPDIINSGIHDPAIILLPTAVPFNKSESKTDSLCDAAFEAIKSQLLESTERFNTTSGNIIDVDGSFCTYETCLHEVELFKWSEYILGTKCKKGFSYPESLDKYADRSAMPQDAANAYDVYKRLAKKLMEKA